MENVFNAFLFDTGDVDVPNSDEWEKAKAVLPNLNMLPILVVSFSTDMVDMRSNLTPTEWQLITHINGQDTITTIARKTGRNELETAKDINHLIVLGLVEEKSNNSWYGLYNILRRYVEILGNKTYSSLLDHSYQRLDITDKNDVSFEQALELLSQFERLLTLLIGTERAKTIAVQMQTLVKNFFDNKA